MISALKTCVPAQSQQLRQVLDGDLDQFIVASLAGFVIFLAVEQK